MTVMNVNSISCYLQRSVLTRGGRKARRLRLWLPCLPAHAQPVALPRSPGLHLHLHQSPPHELVMTSPSSPSPTQPQPNEGTMSTAAEQIAAKARRLAPYFTSGIVTLQGPQGSGKSALVKALVELKRKEGVRCAAASLDGE